MFFYFQFPWLLSTKSKFIQLKYLKLLLPQCSGDMDNIVYLASFLKAAPLLEVLEIPVSTFVGLSSLVDMFM